MTLRVDALLVSRGGNDLCGDELLWLWIEHYGIPQSLYTDKKNVYVIDEKTRQIAADSGLEVLTQFGRACKQLRIEIITHIRLRPKDERSATTALIKTV